LGGGPATVKRPVVAQHTHLLAHLSEWLDDQGLAADDLNTDVLHAYLLDRRAAGYGFLISLRGMAPMLRYVCGLDVIRSSGCRHRPGRWSSCWPGIAGT